MSTDIKSVLQQQVEKWPLEDQKELGQAAIAIEAQRRGVDPGALEQFARKLTIAVATQELEEPTKYWRDWKDNYLYNAKRWALGFLIPLLTTVLAIVLLLIFQPQFLEISRDNEKVAIAQAIQHVVIFGTIVAAVFWGLRQVLRMWAYYDDMRADAVEREALFKTFAVLKGAGWLSAPDQTVILTALVNKTRRSNVIGPEALVTPIDALTKQLAETIKKSDKHH